MSITGLQVDGRDRAKLLTTDHPYYQRPIFLDPFRAGPDSDLDYHLDTYHLHMMQIADRVFRVWVRSTDPPWPNLATLALIDAHPDDVRACEVHVVDDHEQGRRDGATP